MTTLPATIAETSATSSLSVHEQAMLTDFLSSLQQVYGSDLLAIILFGSKARGQSDDESDIDLAIILTDVDPDVRRDIRHLATDAWLEYGVYLSTRVWRLAHWQQLQTAQTALYQNIRQDGVLLLNKDNSIDMVAENQISRKKTVQELFGEWQGQVVYYEDINTPTIEHI